MGEAATNVNVRKRPFRDTIIIIITRVEGRKDEEMFTEKRIGVRADIYKSGLCQTVKEKGDWRRRRRRQLRILSTQNLRKMSPFGR